MEKTNYTLKLNECSLKKERIYDFVYDPTCKFSSTKDYNRSIYRARVDKQQINPAPIFSNMFSELGHYPKLEYMTKNCCDMIIPNPKLVNDYRVRADKSAYLKTDPSGKDRMKFFKRPIIPAYTTTAFVTDSMYPSIAKDTGDKIAKNKNLLKQQLANVSIQTDYRENDCQTDPYSPEYVYNTNGSIPEILTLVNLKHGCGLPAGLVEIESIERAREKRLWESQLPPLENRRLHKKRLKIMERIEEKDYQYRDMEIEKFHKRKLQVIIENIEKNNLRRENNNKEIINKQWRMKFDERSKNNQKQNLKYLRDLRKLHGRTTCNQKRQNIIEDYLNPGSTVFAPLTRLGVFPDVVNNFGCQLDKCYNSIKELSEIDEKIKENEKYLRKMSVEDKYTAMGFMKRNYREKQKLDEIYESLKDCKQESRRKSTLRMLIRIEKEPERPVTPVAAVIGEEEEDNERLTIILTKTLRGRLNQYKFLKEKHSHLELLEEVKSTYGISEESAKEKNDRLKKILELQRSRESESIKENKLKTVINHIEGSIVGETADYISKELIRIQDERRIEKFINLAEDERLKREAEEAGRRQIEERRRIEEEDIFKQILHIHQECASHYLEDLIVNKIEALASRQSAEHIEEISADIDQVNYLETKEEDERNSQEIIAELVHGFLFPEVQKECERTNVANNDNKYLNTAKSVLFKF